MLTPESSGFSTMNSFGKSDDRATSQAKGSPDGAAIAARQIIRGRAGYFELEGGRLVQYHCTDMSMAIKHDNSGIK